MLQAPLGSTGLRVSRVGFGGWQLGGTGWGRMPEGGGARAVTRALELGINLFDTAPVYGFGRSEEILGSALRGARDAVVVSKGGLIWDDRRRVAHDNRPESLARQLDGTLRRLRREHLDVYLLHWPDPAVPLAESAAALESFRAAGKLRAWGVSNFPAAEVLALSPGSLVLEYPLNALDAYPTEHRESAGAARELLPVVVSRGWGFIAFDVLARGLLGGRRGPTEPFGKRDVRSRDDRFAGEALGRNAERASRIAAEARDARLSPAAFALRSVLAVPGVTAALAGMRTPAQVEENASAAT